MRDSRTIRNTPSGEIRSIAEARLERLNWSRKRRNGTLAPIICRYCDKSFVQSRWWQKFCSPTCRSQHFLFNKVKEALSDTSSSK